MRDTELHIRNGAFLPHWTKPGSVYHVRFRLVDSLPQTKLEAWKEEREELLKKAMREVRKLTQLEQRELDFLFSEKVEEYLDAGYGACWLGQDAIACVVAECLQHFADDRYELLAWCIMPNHVHVVVQPLSDWELHVIVHTWKSYTAKRANKLLKRSGAFWQREYFDHLLRNTESIERCIQYVWSNPDEAGLKNWHRRWQVGRN